MTNRERLRGELEMQRDAIMHAIRQHPRGGSATLWNMGREVTRRLRALNNNDEPLLFWHHGDLPEAKDPHA